MAKKSRRPARGVSSTTRPPATTGTPITGDADASSDATPTPISTSASAPTTPPASAASTTRSSTGKPSRRVRRSRQQTFFEKYRSWIIGGAFLAGLLLIGFVFFQGANTKAYVCAAELTPGPVESVTPRPSVLATPTPAATATSAPSGTPAAGTPAASATPAASGTPAASTPDASASPATPGSPAASPGASPTPVPDPTNRLGFTTDILGRTHVQTGSTINYAFCPPTSGNHYIAQGRGPIPYQFYAPNEEKAPGGWVHNLEHGAVVVAYRCPSGVVGQGDCVSQAELDQMRQWFDNAPANEVAVSCPNKVLVVRFDSMDTKFAQLAWGRVLLTDDFNLDRANQFDQQWREHDAVPEASTC